MTIAAGSGILVEERVTVVLEGGRIFVPKHSVQVHQPRILYILFIHVHYAVKSGANHSRVKPGAANKDEPRMNTNRHEYEWISFGFSSGHIRNKNAVPLIRLSTY